jgi:hypothetical protein
VLAIVAIALGSWWYQHSQSLAIRDRSIAVLPFENLSSDKENAFFTGWGARRNPYASGEDRRPESHQSHFRHAI